MNNINRTNSPKIDAIELTRLLTRLPMDPQYLKTPKKYIKVGKDLVASSPHTALQLCFPIYYSIKSKMITNKLCRLPSNIPYIFLCILTEKCIFYL